MTGWHTGALCAFDTETTGTDTTTDRIVTAAFIRIQPGAEPAARTWLINPGVDIPAEATAVHGITSQRARDEGMDPRTALGEIIHELECALTLGVPLIAYNAPFDLTILDRECRRHGITAAVGDALREHSATVIDPLVLDKHVDRYRRGSRKLADVCVHYGTRIDGAHDASHDALAAARVAWQIASRNPEIAAMDLAELHQLQIKARAGQAASFGDYLRRQGKTERVDGCWPVCTCEEVAA